MGISLTPGDGAVRDLHDTIRSFAADTQKQTRQLIVLTRWIASLTAVLVVGLIVQIVHGG